MDYNVFYDEVKAWISQCNQMAIQHGIHSNDFWIWITRSIGDICDKYDNNKLVVMQFAMMYDWLSDIYHNR